MRLFVIAAAPTIVAESLVVVVKYVKATEQAGALVRINRKRRKPHQFLNQPVHHLQSRLNLRLKKVNQASPPQPHSPVHYRAIMRNGAVPARPAISVVSLVGGEPVVINLLLTSPRMLLMPKVEFPDRWLDAEVPNCNVQEKDQVVVSDLIYIPVVTTVVYGCSSQTPLNVLSMCPEVDRSVFLKRLLTPVYKRIHPKLQSNAVKRLKR